MRYLALATDYDGTLAEHGSVGESTLHAVKRLKESGRRAILVTGRQLSDLRTVFPSFALFDRIVAENGAHVFAPETGEEYLLGSPPPRALAELLGARGVTPLSLGKVIMATWEPHQHAVLEAIQQLGLELQVIFNKGAVMVLPSGVNKASGLRAALKDLGLSVHNVVAVGDAENDHALLAACELGVAVANALPVLKQRADLVTSGERGRGVQEVITRMIEGDLSELEARLSRHDLFLSAEQEGEDAVPLHPYGGRVLLCGTSGSGKSTLATAFLERLSDAGYQFCLIDPEGDFDGLADVVTLGDEYQPPKTADVAQVLSGTQNSAIVNLLGLPLEKRSAFLAALLPRLSELRLSTGRPHWIVIDEAHHMLPEEDVLLPDQVLSAPHTLLLITVHPERLAKQVLKQIDSVIVVGATPRSMLHSFAARSDGPAMDVDEAPLAFGSALFWRPGQKTAPRLFRAAAPKLERHRHRRKYAAGELGEDKSFYFRGPDQRLQLRAQNLQLFLQLADGVDDETWQYHLARHDYSHWIRAAIKNEELADEIAHIESSPSESPAETRQKVRSAIGRVYTLPA